MIIIERAGLSFHTTYRWLVRTDSDHWAKFCSDLDDLSTFLRLELLIIPFRLELDMKYTHLLELSTTEPRQYRITVLEEKPSSMLTQAMKSGEDFNIVGWYDTPDELMDVLVPYLQMEGGK